MCAFQIPPFGTQLIRSTLSLVCQVLVHDGTAGSDPLIPANQSTDCRQIPAYRLSTREKHCEWRSKWSPARLYCPAVTAARPNSRVPGQVPGLRVMMTDWPALRELDRTGASAGHQSGGDLSFVLVFYIVQMVRFWFSHLPSIFYPIFKIHCLGSPPVRQHRLVNLSF